MFNILRNQSRKVYSRLTLTIEITNVTSFPNMNKTDYILQTVGLILIGHKTEIQEETLLIDYCLFLPLDNLVSIVLTRIEKQCKSIRPEKVIYLLK